MPSPKPAIPPAILFVCLGNICRSPLAEAAFRSEAERAGLDVAVDSAGTGAWHAGEPPDRRNGVDISHSRARQVEPADFTRFSHIVALDRDNLAILQRMRPQDGAAVSLLLDHVPGRGGEAVADPYYGAEEGFDVTWADVADGARHLVRVLRR